MKKVNNASPLATKVTPGLLKDQLPHPQEPSSQ
jgi:hypothetical protein